MPIDMLILHYTGMRSAAEAIARLCDPVAAVSSHYVIDEDGAVTALVPEEQRAQHAGVSHWRGHENLNDRSIGLEIVNPGHEWGYRPFPEPQIAAVERLCLGILERHPIPSRNVVGHSDVAPDRKQDPGELFPWRHLAERGIGHWPAIGNDPLAPEALDETDTARLMINLAGIGYRIEAAGLVAAFQRHWRPERVDGIADRGTAHVADLLSQMATAWS
jgi:N-acetylmuramoyl-L-alanine amidase